MSIYVHTFNAMNRTQCVHMRTVVRPSVSVNQDLLTMEMVHVWMKTTAEITVANMEPHVLTVLTRMCVLLTGDWKEGMFILVLHLVNMEQIDYDRCQSIMQLPQIPDTCFKLYRNIGCDYYSYGEERQKYLFLCNNKLFPVQVFWKKNKWMFTSGLRGTSVCQQW